MPKTKVVFLMEKPEGDLPCNVFAYFPEMDCDANNPDMFTCYAHIGQHSACHKDYAKECKEAEYRDYWPLLKELISRGYKLEVLNKQPIEYGRNPTDFEIKQGYGAKHYRDFTASEFINTKTGDFKKWFIADDGLRYSR